MVNPRKLNLEVFFVLAVVFAFQSYVSARQIVTDPGIADTVRVQRIQVSASPANPVKFGVKVTMYNDEELCAATYGFYYTSDDITADSVSWLGSSASHLASRPIWIKHDIKLVAIGFAKVSEHSGVVAGDSLLATIWFTLVGGAQTQTAVIDSGFFPPVGQFISVLCDANEFVPRFKPGEVIISGCEVPLLQQKSKLVLLLLLLLMGVIFIYRRLRPGTVTATGK